MQEPGRVATMTDNVRWQRFQPGEARWTRMGQRPVIVWLTGLPAAGKTSIANVTDRALGAHGRHSTILDGDNLRHGLCRDLGFSAEDRAENVRRAAEVARMMAEAGLIVLVALISPSRAERAQARKIAGEIPFLEVFVDTPPSLCEARDPKGLYKLARAERITNFTGVSAPYETPTTPDIVIRTDNRSPEISASLLIAEIAHLSNTWS